ncbi:extracellular serine-rich protein [Metarhizium album ARSEF 1941]|uniref:Extracellular serine-rich protein n=1 Tax=Metarhizium album (strain ARSEF 1941) TaxID=1081103 RepID=A0A0B2WYP9_METAS|nr:extracellular serine-rich protein [Metarhizium album ARSEF 1941]KHN98699.1 extracellular serine-rich protein [Metarhizium album ARSEF 1941]
MLFATAKGAVLSALAAQASAKTIKIAVGKDGLTFTPDSVTASQGDVLEYHFYKQHSVAMGDFSNGCAPAPQGGFFSGVVKTAGDGANKQVFQVTVNNTDPMAVYCTVGRHCQNGMVHVVNPSSTNSLDTYKSVSNSAGANVAPPTMFGGKMVESAGASGTASSAQSKTTGAASHMQASLRGISAAALGFAVLLL